MRKVCSAWVGLVASMLAAGASAQSGGRFPDGGVLLPVEALAQGGECIPSDTVLCLDADRFQVSVTWQNFVGGTGVGHAENLSDTSGTFWFFAASNVEMLVKTVDACAEPAFNNFWFFAAATTNVLYDITVADTRSGAIRHYHNNLGVASPAITDTNAFETCAN